MHVCPPVVLWRTVDEILGWRGALSCHTWVSETAPRQQHRASDGASGQCQRVGSAPGLVEAQEMVSNASRGERAYTRLLPQKGKEVL